MMVSNSGTIPELIEGAAICVGGTRPLRSITSLNDFGHQFGTFVRGHDIQRIVPGIDTDDYEQVKPHALGGPVELGAIPKGPDPMKIRVCEDFGAAYGGFVARSSTFAVLAGLDVDPVPTQD